MQCLSLSTGGVARADGDGQLDKAAAGSIQPTQDVDPDSWRVLAEEATTDYGESTQTHVAIFPNEKCLTIVNLKISILERYQCRSGLTDRDKIWYECESSVF